MHDAALGLAGIFEVTGAYMLNRFADARNLRKKALFVLLLMLNFAISLALLRYAMRAIDMSVAYAIWTGIGAVGAVLVGVIWFKNRLNLNDYFCLFLVIFSAIMLKLI